jgi:UDP-2,4-diacetamido-2,4,6-trideoxy-beta-L-altropyranose hydrolase
MSRPLIVFRTEGGPKIGLGHIRRSMTLAKELEQHGATVLFVLPEDAVSLDILGGEGFSAITVAAEKDLELSETLKCMESASAHCAVIDAYNVLDFSVMAGGAYTVVIDDLAERSLPVNLIINGGVEAGSLSYRASEHTQLLLGPTYSLLRKEFSAEPVRQHKARVDRILITLGGLDNTALSADIVSWIRETLPDSRVDLVIGAFFNRTTRDKIRDLAKEDPAIHTHENPPHMRELMLACDVAVTGGGQTTYELAATGTPGLAVRIADNQTSNLRGISANGAIRWIGDAKDTNLKEKLVSALRELAGNRAARGDMSRAGRRLVDGAGTERVARAILQGCTA